MLVQSGSAVIRCSQSACSDPRVEKSFGLLLRSLFECSARASQENSLTRLAGDNVISRHSTTRARPYSRTKGGFEAKVGGAH